MRRRRSSIFFITVVIMAIPFMWVMKNSENKGVEVNSSVVSNSQDDKVVQIEIPKESNEELVPINEESQQEKESSSEVESNKEADVNTEVNDNKNKEAVKENNPIEKSTEDNTVKESVKEVVEKEKIDKVDTDKQEVKNKESEEEIEIVVSDPPAEEAVEPVAETKEEPKFVIDSISEDVKKRIVDVSWNSECPVSLDNLSYVKISYLDFNNETKVGELIVHKKVAQEIVDIFKELYNGGFQIAKMSLVDNYGADDTKSMEDNNTSAFNYRPVAGTTKLSKHSYGIAIDINPIQNPYIKGDYVSPKDGKKYLDRSKAQKGMIVKNDICYKAFKSRGWIWGGEWNTMKDYQHFQKKIDLELLVK